MFSQSQSFSGKSMVPSFLPWDQVESAADGGGKFRWRDQLQCVHQRLPGRATMVTMVARGWAKIQRGYIPHGVAFLWGLTSGIMMN